MVNSLCTSLYVGFYLSLLLLQEQAALHPLPLGIVMSLELASHTLGGHMLVYDNTTLETPERFLSHNGLVSRCMASWPPSAPDRRSRRCRGWPGSVSSSPSRSCSSRRPPGSPSAYRHGQPEPYRIWRVFPGRHTGWRRPLLADTFFGTRDGIFGFTVSLLVLLATGGERLVGNYAFLTAASELAAYWLAGGHMRPANRQRLSPRRLWHGCRHRCDWLGSSWGVMLAHGLLNAIANPVWSTAFDAIREAS